MSFLRSPPPLFLAVLVLLIFWVRPSHAFGAGNIASMSKIEGQNWRHGDIEDTLLTLLISRSAGKKFSKMDVKRVYFGNWLRDYSQAVDVGTLKMVSGEAIRILLWILGFMSFGYGTGSFEVTTARLGCYRPEAPPHIDNPKDYADNMDATQYDRRLRGPVRDIELEVDERTGLKNYIASEHLRISTSAGLVRDLFQRCIDLGRRYNRNGNKDDWHECLRLLGTALHCLEDYSAHSNFVELALIELGERDVFPHVGSRTQMRVQGAREPVWPLITGTFGGVDFLHSVVGEFSDKATQSEIQELEGTIAASESQQANNGLLKDLLSKLPDGLFGGKDESGKADELQANAAAHQMQNTHITPRQPEAWQQQMQEVQNQIYPILEYHDEIMQGISETIDKIPVLPELIEQVQEQINVFVFSLLAPYILPILRQVKEELSTGSSEVIQSSKQQQHVVFNDDRSTDPTHSMLSKDHFSNVLNEPAGKIASQVLKWVVPQIVDCWDDENIDPQRTINRVINGVFHHPALRQYGDDGASDGRQLMFQVVKNWWSEQGRRGQDDLREKLSRRGVENGQNHKEGVHDKGHGCGKPLGMPNVGTSKSSGAIGGSVLSALQGGSSGGYGGNQNPAMNQASKMAAEAVGGGALGGLVGGLVSGVGADLLGGAFGEEEKTKKKKDKYNDDGSYTQSSYETGRRRDDDGDHYGQAGYQRTEYPSGGHSETYRRQEQDHSYGRTEQYSYQQTVETSGYSSGGGYSTRREERVENPSGWQSRETREGFNEQGEYQRSETKHYGSKQKDSEDEDSNDDDEDDWKKREKKERKKREKEEKKRREQQYGGRDDDSDEEKQRRRRKDDESDDDKKYRQRRDSNDHKRRSGEHRSGGYGQEQANQGYGQERSYGQEQSYSQPPRNEYGSRDEYASRQESSYGGGRDEYGSGRGGSYGQQQYGGGENYGQQQSGGGGGGYGERQQYGGQDEYSRRTNRDMPGGFEGSEDQEGYGRRQQGGGYGQGGYGYGGSGY